MSCPAKAGTHTPQPIDSPVAMGPGSRSLTLAWPGRSEELSVPGFARQLAQIDADLAQRLVVFAIGVGAEDQFRIGGAMQPAVRLDFVFQLPGRPAGIAEREDGALRPVAARDRLEDVERGGEADAFVDRQRRVLDEEIGRVQYEAAPGFHRPALEHLDVFR